MKIEAAHCRAGRTILVFGRVGSIYSGLLRQTNTATFAAREFVTAALKWINDNRDLLQRMLSAESQLRGIQIMMFAQTMRLGAVAVTLACALIIQSCSSPDQTMTAQGTRLLANPAANTGPYSGSDSVAALNAAMTSNNGGGD
jgi:hypothetical protein